MTLTPCALQGVILGRGESSRMNQSLVYHQQIASDVSVDSDLRDDASLFTVYDHYRPAMANRPTTPKKSRVGGS